LVEGLRPSISPARSLAGTPAPLRSRGSLASLVRSANLRIATADPSYPPASLIRPRPATLV
jgi:hypothetical protein